MNLCGKLLASTLCLGVMASMAGATNYYVSPNGNDNNPGTKSKPWKTIDKVNATWLNPGDGVYFLGGKTFKGNLYLGDPEGGTADKPIVFGSYGSGRATIDAGTGSALFAYDTAGIRVENLKAVGSGRANGNKTDGISFYSDIAIVGNKLDTIQIENVDVSGFGVAGISVGSFAYDYDKNLGIKTGFKNISISRVVAHDNDDIGISVYGTFTGYYGPEYPEYYVPGYSHENVYVRNSRAYHNTGYLGKKGNSGNGIVISDVENGGIECSVAYNNGENNDNKSGGPIGIWAWESKNVVIQYNESFNNKTLTGDGGGFDLDGGCVNCVMQYNYSHDNYGSGYLVYQFYTARPMLNNIVRRNISWNDGRTNGGGVAYGGGMDGLLVEDNLFAFGPAFDGAEGPFGVSQVVDGAVNSNVTIRRNTFAPKGKQTVIKITDLALQPNIKFQDNCYRTKYFRAIWGDKEYDSLSAWRAATGQEP